MMARLIESKKNKIIIAGLLAFIVLPFIFSSPSTSQGKMHTTQTPSLGVNDLPGEELQKLSVELRAISQQNKLLREQISNQQQHYNKAMENFEQKLNDIEQKAVQEYPVIKQESSSDYIDESTSYQVGSNPVVSEIIWVKDRQDKKINIDLSEAIGGKTNETSIPAYTIPANATLLNAVTMTSLIGRTPVKGRVTSPYPFKVLLGDHNLATNGLEIPELTGIVASGVVTGDMMLSCVRAEIDSLTFTFEDGRISTTKSDNIGYLSTPTGSPCISGKFYTNAPEFLAGQVALAGVEGATAGLSESQLTKQRDHGGASSFLSGKVSDYMFGRAGEKGASAAQQWWAERMQDSFDAVYVTAGQKVVINIQEEVAIDYNELGRKIRHG